MSEFSSIRASHYFARMLTLLLVIWPMAFTSWVDLLPFFFKDPTNLGTIWYLKPYRAFSLNALLFVMVVLFMYVVLAAFLGSMVSS